MGKKKEIPFERGSYEWGRQRTLNKKIKNEFNLEYRFKRILCSAKARAKNKGMEYDIDHYDLLRLWEEQGGLCAVSGKEIELAYDDRFFRNPHGPSVDRIESSKGYTKNNIRLVTTQVNVALGNFGEELFLEMCKRVVSLEEEFK